MNSNASSIMESLIDMTDEQILDAYDAVRSRMSFFNAAEGNWGRETGARNACSTRLDNIRGELESRGLVARPGQYLL